MGIYRTYSRGKRKAGLFLGIPLSTIQAYNIKKGDAIYLNWDTILETSRKFFKENPEALTTFEEEQALDTEDEEEQNESSSEPSQEEEEEPEEQPWKRT